MKPNCTSSFFLHSYCEGFSACCVMLTICLIECLFPAGGWLNETDLRTDHMCLSCYTKTKIAFLSFSLYICFLSLDLFFHHVMVHHLSRDRSDSESSLSHYITLFILLVSYWHWTQWWLMDAYCHWIQKLHVCVREFYLFISILIVNSKINLCTILLIT